MSNSCETQEPEDLVEEAKEVVGKAKEVAEEAEQYYKRSLEINEETKSLLSEVRTAVEESEKKQKDVQDKIEEWTKNTAFPWGDFMRFIRDYALTVLAIFGVLLAILSYVDVTPSPTIQNRGGYLEIFVNEVAIGILLSAIAITILSRFVMWVWFRRTSK